ncbi:MAG: response regulator [SAR324 cluster bacterium]|nr:response regulator [SAR324 cluster bacterium]MBF0352626.1 response regulator [SAR324 cluster bacterium]
MIPTILLVDDDEDQKVLLLKLLEEFHLIIETAASGKEAVSKARHKEYALIVMDVQMPGISGIKATELIRYLGSSKNSSIILVTGKAFDSIHTQQAYYSGALDYLQKPLDPIIFKQKIFNFIQYFKQKILLQEQKNQFEEKASELSKLNQQLTLEIQQRNLIEQQWTIYNDTLKKQLDQLFTEFSNIQSNNPSQQKALEEALQQFKQKILHPPQINVESERQLTKLFNMTSRNENLSSKNFDLIQRMQELVLENSALKDQLFLLMKRITSNS